jgi:hypothetical protein
MILQTTLLHLADALAKYWSDYVKGLDPNAKPPEIK